MTGRDLAEGGNCREEQDLPPFRSLQRLTNHWARPTGPRSYYWFLTFDHDPDLQSFVQRCQRSISFPYYDLTAPANLHMTLERIAFEDEISPQQLEAVADAAAISCRDIAPLEITVRNLGGTSGAIGFSAYPRPTIQDLRNVLRAATFAAHPAARLRRPTFHPHITIAYCNAADTPAAQAIAAVESLRSASTTVTIKEVSLVFLTRRPRAYTWTTVDRLPLTGTSQPSTTMAKPPTSPP